jgi:isopropylmalate/homocitrate/citramalate synthase
MSFHALELLVARLRLIALLITDTSPFEVAPQLPIIKSNVSSTEYGIHHSAGSSSPARLDWMDTARAAVRLQRDWSVMATAPKRPEPSFYQTS